MCVCVCVCVYIYMYICVCVCVYIYIYIYVTTFQRKHLPSYVHPEDHEPPHSTFLENVTITYIQTHLTMVCAV